MITFQEGSEFQKNPDELKSSAIELIQSLHIFTGSNVSETKKPEFERLCQELRKMGEKEGKSYEKIITGVKETIKWVEE